LAGIWPLKKTLILFTDALAFQLRNTTVTSNSLHPGAVATSLGVSRQTGFGQSIYKMLTPFFKTAEEGADTAIYLALSPDVAGISGHYFVDRQAVPTEIPKEQQQAQKIWQETQQRIADHTK